MTENGYVGYYMSLLLGYYSVGYISHTDSKRSLLKKRIIYAKAFALKINWI
jgi:hypothetical protein